MEDFVTFNLAKKLREKGFREKVNAYYGKHENIFDVHPALDMNDADYRASAPTISQVLKWLREEKSIHVEVFLWTEGWYYEVWSFEYNENYKEYDTKIEKQSMDYSSYEEAALAGIEYVLDNLP